MCHRLPDVAFRCVANARDLTGSLDGTHRKLWAANLALVIPLGWYRYQVGGKAEAFFLRDKCVLDREGNSTGQRLCRGDIQLLRALHMHTVTPVRSYELDPEGHRSKPLSRDAFVKRKQRINSILPAGVIETISDPDGRRAELGYIFQSGLKRFMVIGVTRGQMTDKDWEVLLTPP